MKTAVIKNGTFTVVSKTINVTVKFGPAILRCEVQKGTTPLGNKYRSKPQWWIKLNDLPWLTGPMSARDIRKYYTETP